MSLEVVLVSTTRWCSCPMTRMRWWSSSSVEPDDEPFEWNPLAAVTEKAAVSTTALVASQRLVREMRPKPRLRAAGDVSDSRVMPWMLDDGP